MRRALVVLMIGTVACGGGTSGPSTTPPPAMSSVDGLVFYDEDGNGVLADRERVRLAGVRVTASGQAATSDAAGRFSLSAPNGSQVLTVQVDTLPPFFQQGPVPTVTLPVAAGTVVPVPIALPTRTNHPNRYLAFGDSLTDGARGPGREAWATPLEAKLRAHWGDAVVVRNGVFGSRSLDGVGRLPGVLATERPAYTLLLYGTNDWTRCPNPAPSACFTVDALRDMIRIVRGAGSMPVVGTIIPANPDYPELGGAARNEWIRLQNDLIRAMVQREGAVVAETWRSFGDNPAAWPPLFVDHVHPNEDGYERIAEAFFAAITRPRGTP